MRKLPRRRKAEEMFGCPHLVLFDDSTERRVRHARAHRESFSSQHLPPIVPDSPQRSGKILKWHPNLLDSVFGRRPRNGLHYDWMQMGVFVAVSVRWLDAGCAHSFDLRANLGFDVTRANHSRAHLQHERPNRPRQLAVIVDQSPDLLARRERASSNQHYVDAYSQLGILLRQTNGVIKRVSIRHDRSTSHDSFPKAANDSAIDPAGHSKVVRIDDQSLH